MEVLTLSNYEFQLANYDDIFEIITIYHSLIGTPGCTWNLDYPSKETAENDINNDWLYTLKKYDKILKNTIRTAKEKGHDGIRMLVSKTNIAALALYDKNGFERCGEVFKFDIDFYCYQITF